MSNGTPDNSDCEVHQGACIIGERIMVQAQSIPKPKVRAHGQHRKGWTKIDNAKCWIEKPYRNLSRSD